MQLGMSDAVLWCSGLLTNTTLLAVLLAKRRLASEPVFTCWIAFDCLSTVSLLLIYQRHAAHLYFLAYWWSAGGDFLLQLGVITELGWSIFRRRGKWVSNARFRVSVFALVSLLSSIAVVILIKPVVVNPLDILFARANLFMTMLFFTGFLSLMSVSRQLGVSWSVRAMRTAYGLSLWIIVSFATDTLHTFWQFSPMFTGLEHARVITFQLVAVYWTVLQFQTTNKEPTLSQNVLSEMLALIQRTQKILTPQVRR